MSHLKIVNVIIAILLRIFHISFEMSVSAHHSINDLNAKCFHSRCMKGNCQVIFTRELWTMFKYKWFKRVFDVAREINRTSFGSVPVPFGGC